MNTLLVKHPYYCTEGNYYDNNCHYTFESWNSCNWRNADEDYNLLYRWDWKPADEDEDDKRATLRLYFMQQRKARAVSVYVRVTDADEPAVKAWLEERWAHMLRLWAPISGAKP